MSGFEIIAIVIGIFFVVGLVVGILLVIALPMLRSILWERRSRRRVQAGGNGWKSRYRNAEDNRPPRWPGS